MAAMVVNKVSLSSLSIGYRKYWVQHGINLKIKMPCREVQFIGMVWQHLRMIPIEVSYLKYHLKDTLLHSHLLTKNFQQQCPRKKTLKRDMKQQLLSANMWISSCQLKILATLMKAIGWNLGSTFVRGILVIFKRMNGIQIVRIY